MSANRPLANSDFISGVLFLLTGATFLVLGTNYSFGSMLRMGPGFFPVLLSCLLMLMGAVILGRSWFRSPEEVSLAAAPMVKILAAVAVFAFFVPRLGLYPTLPAVVLLSAWGSDSFHWRSAILLAVGITIATDLIFRVALGLPLDALGPWLSE